MTNDVQFGLLGPFELRVDGRQMPLRSAQSRILLACLLVEPGRLVSPGELIEAIWGDHQPAHPRRALHVCLVRVRASLAAAGAGDLIVSGVDGYRADVRPDAVDVTLFRQGLAEPVDAEQERRALSLWRGEPFADVPSDYLHRAYGVRLAEHRLHAIERRVDRSLDGGRHAEVIGDLAELTAKYPLRERLWAQLMAALHRTGRRGDAINAYHAARGHLVDELGVEPGEDLRRLHATVLRGPTGGPRQLPAEVRGFAGRAAEEKVLYEECERSGVLAITGVAGVGKTALATHWARRVAERFPDGQVWLDLHGYDRRPPVTPRRAIAAILGALEVPVPDLLDEDELAARYRSVMDGRRVLVVLDNARGAGQIRPLLPGEPRTFVLITSRSDLTPLVTREGMPVLRLGPLATGEARTMLRARLGDEPAVVERIIAGCDGLPMALAVAATRERTKAR